MSIHHFLTALRTPRRHPRPRGAAHRGAARRGWLVQRLEPRCVLAADLFFELDATEAVQIGTGEFAIQPEVPALLASTKPQDDLNGDSAQTPLENESIVEQPPLELVAVIDLSNNQMIELNAQANQWLLLTLDPAALDRLFAQSETLTVQVVFDAARWQLPISQTDDAAFGFEDTTQLDAAPQIDGQIELVSLASQSMRVETTVQLGNADSGTSTQIFIKLIDNDGIANEEPEKLQTEELELVRDWIRDWISMDSISPGSGDAIALELAGNDKSQVDLTTTIDPSDNGEQGTSGPVDSWTGGEPGNAQPLKDNEASPLPETRRDNSERGTRHARRTLDIRSPNTVAWSAPSSYSRSAVTPGSLATQKAIASVYDEDPAIGAAQVRSTLDPKPARLQVATFVLSRVGHRDAPVVMNITKPVAKIPHSSNSERALVQTSAVESTSQPTSQATATATNANHNTSLIRIVAVPTEAEVTIDTKSLRSVESEVDEDDAVDDPSLYAGIVDRLFGSPISMVAILGLTIVARLNDGKSVDV